MAGTCFSSINSKRKDLDDDFSLASPARKIRRLDADFPPIMEEEDPGSLAAVDQQSAAEVDENLERAIVVFNQVNNHPFLHLSPSNFTVSVDSHFISGIKNQSLLSSCCSISNSNTEETANKNNMAVVPWVPSQLHLVQSTSESVPELMEAEQIGEAAMEVEEGNNIGETLEQRQQDGMRANEGLPQWQQQHCLIPQLPYNTCTPIPWSR